MSRKRMIYFVIAILMLIVSEYVLLTELMAEGAPLPVTVSGVGLAASVFLIVRFYREWRNSLK